jgi:isopentenyl-diphosphate delta-isomerase
VAPDILLFANIGAIQLNYGYTIDECQKAVDMIQADALVLHLNPLQEALQPGGNVNFVGLGKKIEQVARKIEVPVIIKEVGWGISKSTAKVLIKCGISAIDVAGAGGTSWSQVEMYRSGDASFKELASIFKDWGISTAESIMNVRSASPRMTIIASGGIKNGLEIVKCIALGASMVGLAGRLLRDAAISADAARQTIQLLTKEMKVSMFTAGMASIKEIKRIGLKKYAE